MTHEELELERHRTAQYLQRVREDYLAQVLDDIRADLFQRWLAEPKPEIHAVAKALDMIEARIRALSGVRLQ